MATIGIIDAGEVGSQIARAALANGYNVVIANSRGPKPWRTSSLNSARQRAPHALRMLQKPAISQSWLYLFKGRQGIHSYSGPPHHHRWSPPWRPRPAGATGLKRFP
ncbi:NAD(P)-binding domain-containing protein [Streptomyces scopuliridis]|uniref:NAD(P)-binding domain-containing protein n=1 Tax=Streptomyces scopuliridis TaxID=452529 RepID=UPI00369B9EDE